MLKKSGIIIVKKKTKQPIGKIVLNVSFQGVFFVNGTAVIWMGAQLQS